MRQGPRAVFLEVEEDSGQAVSVLAPASVQPSAFSSSASKRRSCRAKVVSSHSQHKRAWSVGGSNVHQTMMRRSESHLRRLEQVNEPARESTRPTSSASTASSSSSCSTARRCSLLVDAETQTAVAAAPEPEGFSRSASRRLKGDGIDSPAVERAGKRLESDAEDSEVEDGESYEWQRNRGRASGSSQRFVMSESPAQHEPLFAGPGRRYTVDMSQYKYNDAWNRHHASLHSPHRSGQYNKTLKGTFQNSKSCLATVDCIVLFEQLKLYRLKVPCRTCRATPAGRRAPNRKT